MDSILFSTMAGETLQADSADMDMVCKTLEFAQKR